MNEMNHHEQRAQRLDARADRHEAERRYLSATICRRLASAARRLAWTAWDERRREAGER